MDKLRTHVFTILVKVFGLESEKLKERHDSYEILSKPFATILITQVLGLSSVVQQNLVP